jgi:alpha,alpha-trehalose phosphorylase
LEGAVCLGYDKLKEEQYEFLADFWDKADVEIRGDMPLQQAIRFNLFHLLQSVGRDGKTNICAKGLTGEGYEGHYFWDTEMYVIPAFLYSNPAISRKLLEYRYSTLDKARVRAREMSHSTGALFPWRTINGEECSGYFPAGTAQYHINADIAHAIKIYMEVTQDYEFLLRYGAEVLFETARLWVDLGFFSDEKGGKFCINCVTGPDEYTAIVNNNFYTNLMAKENLEYAYNTAVWLKENHNPEYDRLVSSIGLEPEEIALWNIAADNMYVPNCEKHGIHPQDDSFLEKEVWDFENVPKENYPLLLHYHPLVIYRHQVCKQADVVLALFLLGNKFSLEQKRKDYDYYEKVTTHDSSLSACIFSIVANDIGYHEKAYDYFIKTARMDLDDYQGNTHHGVHTANMAGSWMCIVNGFAGMRVYDSALSFQPYIHPDWEEYSFKINYRGSIIKLTINSKGTTYRLVEGEELEITHRDKRFILKDTLFLD